jgi:hypothetical protein
VPVFGVTTVAWAVPLGIVASCLGIVSVLLAVRQWMRARVISLVSEGVAAAARGTIATTTNLAMSTTETMSQVQGDVRDLKNSTNDRFDAVEAWQQRQDDRIDRLFAALAKLL